MNPAKIQAIILGLPRFSRIFLVMLFAVAIVTLLFPIVDDIYIRNFFDESTLMLPSLVSVGAGLLMYMGGWILIIQQYGTNASQTNPLVSGYLIIAALAIVLDLFLLIQGLFIAL